jgi:hypothetical protein
MNPTTDQLRRLLALPVEARRKLIVPGLGQWITPEGYVHDPWRNPTPANVGECLRQGWAWAPADSAVWMRAAFGGRWERVVLAPSLPTTPTDPVYRGVVQGVTVLAPDPIDCSLAVLEATDAR